QPLKRDLAPIRARLAPSGDLGRGAHASSSRRLMNLFNKTIKPTRMGSMSTDTATPLPNSSPGMEILYVSVDRTCVAFPGPPCVRIQMIEKSLNVRILENRVVTATTGRMPGTVTCRNRAQTP